eukprot:4302852-Prymnesium_polylepis.2
MGGAQRIRSTRCTPSRSQSGSTTVSGLTKTGFLRWSCRRGGEQSLSRYASSTLYAKLGSSPELALTVSRSPHTTAKSVSAHAQYSTRAPAAVNFTFAARHIRCLGAQPLTCCAMTGIVIDRIYYQLRRASRGAPATRLTLDDDGSVRVSTELSMDSAVELNGRVFLNNATDSRGMSTARKQLAWDEMGEVLRSKGLAMVLAYWGQAEQSSYKTLLEWDTFWLNGECQQNREVSPTGDAYPWRLGMGWGCISDIRIEPNLIPTSAPSGGGSPASAGESWQVSLAGCAALAVAAFSAGVIASAIALTRCSRRDQGIRWCNWRPVAVGETEQHESAAELSFPAAQRR